MAGRKGSPYKLNATTIESICTSIAEGVTLKSACGRAGISPRTAEYWREEGWRQLDARADDDDGVDAPLTLHEQFVVSFEAACIEFQAPLVAQWRLVASGDKGASEASYRAARDLLSARFSDQWSEKVAASRSGRMEISGAVAVEHQHGYDQFLAIRNMTMEELQFETERISAQVDHAVIEGDALAAEIGFHQAKLAAMIAAHESGRSFCRANWLVGSPAVRPVALPSPDESPIIDVEEYISDLAAAPNPSGAALMEADGAALTGAASSAEPSPSRTQVGFGFDPRVGTVPLYDDEVGVVFDDEDLSL